MNNYKKTLIFCLLAITLISSPLSAVATHVEGDLKRKKSSAEPGAMMADIVIARPLGIVATIAGSAIFLVSLPFAALGGNTDETLESLVISPMEYTFQRPLGKFDD